MVEDRYEPDGCVEVLHSPNPRGEEDGVDVDVMPPPVTPHRRQLAHPVPGKHSVDDEQAIAALMELPSSPFRSPLRTPSGGRCYVGSSGMGGLVSPLPTLLGSGSPYRDPYAASPFTKFAGALSPLVGNASSQSDMISTSAASTPLFDDGGGSGGAVSRAFRSPTRTDVTLSHHCTPSILSPLLMRQQGVKSSLRRLVHVATPERSMTWQVDSSSPIGIASLDGVQSSPTVDEGCMQQLLDSVKENEGGGRSGFKLIAGLGKAGKGPGGGLMVCVQEVNPEAQFSAYPAPEELAALLGLSRTELSTDLGGVDSDYDSDPQKGGIHKMKKQEPDDDGTDPSLTSSRSPSPYEQGERLFPGYSLHESGYDDESSNDAHKMSQVRGKSLSSTPVSTSSGLLESESGRRTRRTLKRTFHGDDEDTECRTPSSNRKRPTSTEKRKVIRGKRKSTLKRVDGGGNKHKTAHKMGGGPSRASKKLKSASHAGGGNAFDSPVSTDPTDKGISPPNMAGDGEDCRGGKPSHVLHPCTCKKSRCLKLYCDCFANSKQCSAACKCVSCLNRSETEDKRQAAIQSTLDRNPKAFCNKVQLKSVGVDSTHAVGCNCKKSACLKKYCECFQLGMTCSGRCKCVSCLNFDGSEDLAKAKRKGSRSGHVRVLPKPRPLSAPEPTIKVLPVLNRECTTTVGEGDNTSVGGEGGDKEDAEYGNKSMPSSENKEQVSRSLLCLLPDAVPKRSSSISAPNRFSRPMVTDASPAITSSKLEVSMEQESLKLG